MTVDRAPLPPKPEPPQDYDCCGGGCADCDLRLYLRRLAEWKQLEMAQRQASNDAMDALP